MNENSISKPNSIKCYHCKKKSHILMECSCTQKFCLKCRHPEDHICSFNFKEKGIAELVKNNPIIVGEKVVKI